jgi:hypothetical protein
MPMAKRPTPEVIAEGLTVRERILFCIGSDTDSAAGRRDEPQPRGRR